MARVIKGGGQAADRRNPEAQARVAAFSGDKRVIDRAHFQAKQDAETILAQAQQERQRRLLEGKKLAARAREEAMAKGASKAFAETAMEALQAFRTRAERYASATDEISILAAEVVKKILGVSSGIAERERIAIVKDALAQARAHRKLRVQLAPERWQALRKKRPRLWAALYKEPDIVVEADDNVGVGFARVVTEVGSALCQEDDVLAALRTAVEPEEGTTSSDSELHVAGDDAAADDAAADDDLLLYTDDGVGAKKRDRGPPRKH